MTAGRVTGSGAASSVASSEPHPEPTRVTGTASVLPKNQHRHHHSTCIGRAMRKAERLPPKSDVMLVRGTIWRFAHGMLNHKSMRRGQILKDKWFESTMDEFRDDITWLVMETHLVTAAKREEMDFMAKVERVVTYDSARCTTRVWSQDCLDVAPDCRQIRSATT